jgi:hypothetical protein
MSTKKSSLQVVKDDDNQNLSNFCSKFYYLKIEGKNCCEILEPTVVIEICAKFLVGHCQK